MSLPTPRLLPEHLHAFLNPSRPGTGQPTIRILGAVSSLRGETATITCGTHGDVNLILNRDSHLQMGRMVDVVGKLVEGEGGVSTTPSEWVMDGLMGYMV
jgi:hypothetical protein